MEKLLLFKKNILKNNKFYNFFSTFTIGYFSKKNPFLYKSCNNNFLLFKRK